MANVTLKAPDTASSCSFDGEDIPIRDGHVIVSERIAQALHSHGYTAAAPVAARAAPAAKVLEPDDEPVDIGEEDAGPDPDTMNKDELKAFLAGEDIRIPKGSSVGALRALVRTHLEAKTEKE